MSGVVIDLYTVQIVCDDLDNDTDYTSLMLHALMDEMAENVTDLLPAGYRARIRRWDHPDQDDQTQEES